MKFMSKKCSDWTGADTLKWIAVLYGVMIALYGAAYAAICYSDQIKEAWHDFKHWLIWGKDGWDSEEDEELD